MDNKAATRELRRSAGLFHVRMYINASIINFTFLYPILHTLRLTPNHVLHVTSNTSNGVNFIMMQVAGEAVQSSSLPVHPLFLSTPMVQYPTHLHPVPQSVREGDSSRRSIQSVTLGNNISNDPHDGRGSSSSESDGVVLTSDISVGLPSEGPVSASLVPPY